MRAVCQYLFEKLAYLAWHDDAEKRTARGEQQSQCASCELWRWAHEQAACPRFIHADPKAKAREDAKALLRSEKRRTP